MIVLAIRRQYRVLLRAIATDAYLKTITGHPVELITCTYHGK